MRHLSHIWSCGFVYVPYGTKRIRFLCAFIQFLGLRWASFLFFFELERIRFEGENTCLVPGTYCLFDKVIVQ